MDDLIERFRELDELEAPDVWRDATTRDPRPPRTPTTGRRALVAAFALGLAAATLVFVVVALRGGDDPNRNIGSSPSPEVGSVMSAHESLETILGRLWTAREILWETRSTIEQVGDEIRILEAEIGGAEPTEQQAEHLRQRQDLHDLLAQKELERARLVATLEQMAVVARSDVQEVVSQADPADFPDEAVITCKGDGDGGTSVSTPIVRPQADGVHLVVINEIDERAFLDVGDASPTEVAAADRREIVLGYGGARTLEIACTYQTPYQTWVRPTHPMTVASTSVLPAIFARGNDPIGGEWWLSAEGETPNGPVLHVQGPHFGGGLILEPLEDRVLGDRLISYVNDGNRLLVVIVVSSSVNRVVLELDSGSVIEGRLYPLPPDLIGEANVFVAGFRGDLTVEGQELEPNGAIVAFDENADEVARRRLVS